MVDAVTSALAAANQSKTDTSRTSLANNFEMFLTLLTEQLKNQDPLSPLDSNQFVDQLVQFSSVEQQINQNASLDTLVGLQVANVGGAAVGYLGKEIQVNSPEASLGESGAVWSYTVDDDVESVSLAVTDPEGKVVYSAEGEPEAGEHGFNWDGADSQGHALPYGAYTLSTSAKGADGVSKGVSVRTYGIVTGVDLAGAEPVLLMGQARAPFSQIEAVRDPVQAIQATD